MRHLKFIGSAIIVASAFSVSASAADLKPLYAKAPIIAGPMWDWSGFYIGGNVGYGVSRSPTENYFINPSVPPSVQLGNSTPTSAAGVIGGGQIGYNVMSSSGFLFGLETDFQGADQRTRNVTDISGFYGPGAFMAVDSRIDWFGTVRGRIGLAANPATMIYLTGGFAYGRVEVANSSNIGAGFAVGAASIADTKTGYTVGGGIETRLWSNWTARMEYLYVDLGSLALSNPNNNGQTHSSSVTFHDNIVRIGLNYKLDWGRPVTARY
jgi:outer membrane immunogenic protein